MSRMWRNPTYCGGSTNKLLKKPIRGNWPLIVSESNFVKVQAILNKNSNIGYKVDKTNENRPLTKHLICSKCGKPLTGYEVKKKGVHYYKCQTCKGVSINANTTKRAVNKGAHETYTEILSKYKIKDDLLDIYKSQLIMTLTNLDGDDEEKESLLRKREKSINKKEEILTEKLLNEIINDTIYKNEKKKIDLEKSEILNELLKTENKISNLDDFINKSITISQNISNYWASGDYKTRIKIQDFVFPEGVVIDTKKRQYLTKNKNVIFSANEVIAKDIESQKKDFSVKKPKNPV